MPEADRGESPGGGTLRVLGIAGSLRAGSFNRALLRATAALAPAGIEIEIWDGLREIPPYDADVPEAPQPVADLREAITSADAIIITTPEYNHGVPGVLKNAIDWASRPARRSPLLGKPTVLMGAAAGMSGTIRAQIHLREILYSTGTPVFPGPEVYISFARQKFDESGGLTDDATRDHVAAVLAAFDDWTRSLLRSPQP